MPFTIPSGIITTTPKGLEKLSNEVLSIPIHPALRDNDLKKILRVLEEYKP